MDITKKIKTAVKLASFPAFLLMIVFFIINAFITNGFLTSSFFAGFFSSNTPLICIVIGSALVIISGGIDISLGAIITVTNVVFVSLVNVGWSVGMSILFSLLLALAMGAINGFVIGYLNVQPLIATFATNAIFSGIALWILPFPCGASCQDFVMWYADKPLGIPISFIIMLIVFAIGFIILKTPLGVKIYAVGNNPDKAYISGINVNAVRFFVYTFAGITAGIGGLALTAKIGGGNPTIGLSMTLPCIAACAVGGINLKGGYGGCFGALWGVLFLKLVTSTIYSIGINTIYENFVSSIIILIGLVASIEFVNVRLKHKLTKHNTRSVEL